MIYVQSKWSLILIKLIWLIPFFFLGCELFEVREYEDQPPPQKELGEDWYNDLDDEGLKGNEEFLPVGEAEPDFDFELTDIEPVKVMRREPEWKTLYLHRTCRVRSRPSIKSKRVKTQRSGVHLRVRPYNKEWLKSRSGYMSEKCFRE